MSNAIRLIDQSSLGGRLSGFEEMTSERKHFLTVGVELYSRSKEAARQLRMRESCPTGRSCGSCEQTDRREEEKARLREERAKLCVLSSSRHCWRSFFLTPLLLDELDEKRGG